MDGLESQAACTVGRSKGGVWRAPGRVGGAVIAPEAPVGLLEVAWCRAPNGTASDDVNSVKDPVRASVLILPFP